MEDLRIFTFGGLRIEKGGTAVTDLASRKVAALLVYLACTGQPHPREVVAELLWDDRPQARSMGNLRVVLSSLRRHFAPYVTITRRTVAMNRESRYWLDAADLDRQLSGPGGAGTPTDEPALTRVTRLEQGLALYRGEFLKGFHIRDCKGFQDWVAVEQERLRRRVIEARHYLANWYSSQGQYKTAIEQAGALLQLDPLRDASQRQMMLLLDLSGRRNAALEQYDRYCRLLEEELDVEPAEETRALYKQIRNGTLSGVREAVEDGRKPSLRPDSLPDYSPATTLHNLSPQPTPFLGREEELLEIVRLLDEPACRLLTLLGPGGSGKTRLAIQAASENAARYGQDVYFVPLIGASSAGYIAGAIGEAIGFTFSGRKDHKLQLLKYLQTVEGKMLLVIDSFEHLPEGAALLADILAAAPGVEILVTSRQRLRLKREWVYDVQGLRYPGGEREQADPETYDAVRLFVACARRAQADFSLQPDDEPHVIRICQAVDGMPLGIELAAAWVRTLRIAEIAEELEAGVDWLETPLRDVAERHRSLRAAFERSWKLLDRREQSLLKRLSVFEGSFHRAAAEQIAEATLPVLGSLVDKSVLKYTPAGRYELHKLFKQFSREKLQEEPGRNCRI